jgi:hypothetical protein
MAKIMVITDLRLEKITLRGSKVKSSPVEASFPLCGALISENLPKPLPRLPSHDRHIV